MNQSTFYEVRPGYAGEITPSASRLDGFRPLLQVEMFDVGDGQAILVTGPDGRTMLVDGGSGRKKTRIADALALHIPAGSLRAILLTHPHLDHGGAIGPLISGHAEVLAPEVVFYESGVPARRKDSSGHQKWWKDLKAALLASNRVSRQPVTDPIHPSPLGPRVGVALFADQYDEDPPYQSVFAHLTYKRARILFTGDAHCDYENQLLDRYCGEDIFRSHALNVPHHGSQNGTSRRFAAVVSPGIAFASTESDPRGRHEWEKVSRDRLPRECLEFETWTKGDIVLRTDGKRMGRGVLFEVETRPRGLLGDDLDLPPLPQREPYEGEQTTSRGQRTPCDESPPC